MLSENSKVAIILATYNGDSYIGELIDSLLKQTHTNWVLFVHDDNSIDNTANIVKSYSETNRGQVILFDDELSYGNHALNFLETLKRVETCEYDYFMFCDQDDVWLPNKIKESLESIQMYENNSPALLCTDLCIVDDSLNIINESMWRFANIDFKRNDYNYYTVFNNVTGCTTLFNREAKELIENYIPEVLIHHDWWAAQIISLEGRVIHLNKPTILYRQHSDNAVGSLQPLTKLELLCHVIPHAYKSFKYFVLLRKYLKKISIFVFFKENFIKAKQLIVL